MSAGRPTTSSRRWPRTRKSRRTTSGAATTPSRRPPTSSSPRSKSSPRKRSRRSWRFDDLVTAAQTWPPYSSFSNGGLDMAPVLPHIAEFSRGAQRWPRHVAIIMDGNGRWATSRGLPRVAGHSEGVKSVRSIVRAAGEVGIEYLTLYAFSSENWNRPSHEVSTLMSLLERSIDRELPELMARGVRFRVIGRPNGVPADVQRRIDHVVDATAGNTGLNLLMAFNYGARDEIVDACRRLD